MMLLPLFRTDLTGEAMNPKGQPDAKMKGRLPCSVISTGMTTRGLENVFADNGPGIPKNILAKSGSRYLLQSLLEQDLDYTLSKKLGISTGVD